MGTKEAIQVKEGQWAYYKELGLYPKDYEEPLKDSGYSLLLREREGLSVRADIIKDKTKPLKVYVGLGVMPGCLDRVSEK